MLLGLVLLLAGSGWPLGLMARSAQDGPCPEVATLGCTLEPGTSVTAELSEEQPAHLWWVPVPEGADLTVALLEASGAHRVYGYTPDGQLLEAPADDTAGAQVITATAGAAGEYLVVVDNPGGQRSLGRYVLSVEVSGTALSVPVPSEVPAPAGIEASLAATPPANPGPAGGPEPLDRASPTPASAEAAPSPAPTAGRPPEGPAVSAATPVRPEAVRAAPLLVFPQPPRLLTTVPSVAPLSTAGAATTSPPAPPSTVGGRGLTLRSDPPTLSWQGGNRQAGYLVIRWSPLGGQTVLPVGGILPATATGFVDPAPPAEFMYCYSVLAVGLTGVLGLSDLLCIFPVGGGAETRASQFAIRLNQSDVAALTWTPVPGATHQLFAITFDGAAARPIPIPSGQTSATYDTGGAATCFVLTTVAGAAVIGSTDVLCGVPGNATLAAGAPAAEATLADTLHQAAPRFAR